MNLQKKNTKLPMGRKPKLVLSIYSAIILCVTCFMAFAYAANDPIAVVNNLSDFIFGLIRAVGMIMLGFGVVQVGLSSICSYL